MSASRLRERRDHVTVQPARGHVTLTELQQGGQDEQRPVQTQQSLCNVFDDVLQEADLDVAVEETAEPVTAPVELIVTQDPSRDISYTMSFADGLSKSALSRFRRTVGMNYHVEGDSRPFDVVFGAESPAALEFVELWPPGAFTERVPKFPVTDAGEVVTSLVQWLRVSDQPWALQVLAFPCTVDRDVHPAHENNAVVALQVRAAIQTRGSQERTGRRRSILSALGQPPASTALRMTREVHRETVLSEMMAAQLRVARSFVAPTAFARGVVFPPGRIASLKHGVPGTVSPLDDAPSTAIQRVVSPVLPVGTEPDHVTVPSGTQSHSLQFDHVAQVGLPEHSGTVLKIESEHLQRTHTARQELLAHVSTGAPTFILTTEPGMQQRYVEAYCTSQAGPDSSIKAALDAVEYVSGDAIESVFAASFKEATQRVTSWLTGDSEVYVLDVSDTANPRQSSTRVLSLLTRVGETITPSDSRSAPIGNIVYFSPWPLCPSEQTASVDFPTLLDAVARVHDAGLFVTLHTLYPEVELGTLVTDWKQYGRVERDVKYRQLAMLGQRVDAVLASLGGPVARLFKPDRLAAPAGCSPEAVATTYDSEYWLGTFNTDSEASQSVAVPVQRLTAASDTDGVSLDAAQRATVRAALTTTTPSDDTSVAADTDSDTAVPTEPGREHAIRELEDIAVTYDYGRAGYVCEACRADGRDAAVYDRSLDGLLDAVTCCHSLSDVDRAALRHVPEPVLGLSDTAIEDHELSRDVLRLLTVMYLVQRGECDHALEYDPVIDSGMDIRQDIGVTYETETQLADEGYLVRTNSPSKLYSLTTRGLTTIGVDPETCEALPSMYERRLRRAVTLYLTAEYNTNSECDVVQELLYPVAATDSAQPSYATLDVAIQAADGSVVAGVGLWPPVTGIAAPDDTDASSSDDAAHADANGVASDDELVVTYQTLVAAAPETALWCVWRQQDGAELVSQLHAASDEGLVTFEQDAYGENVRIQDFGLDEPGITDVMTIKHVLDAIAPEWVGGDEAYELVLAEEGENDA